MQYVECRRYLINVIVRHFGVYQPPKMKMRKKKLYITFEKW